MGSVEWRARRRAHLPVEVSFHMPRSLSLDPRSYENHLPRGGGKASAHFSRPVVASQPSVARIHTRKRSTAIFSTVGHFCFLRMSNVESLVLRGPRRRWTVLGRGKIVNARSRERERSTVWWNVEKHSNSSRWTAHSLIVGSSVSPGTPLTDLSPAFSEEGPGAPSGAPTKSCLRSSKSFGSGMAVVSDVDEVLLVAFGVVLLDAAVGWASLILVFVQVWRAA